MMNIEWYLMNRNQQLMYGCLLANVQNPCCLTVGGLLPLNWPTCVQVNELNVQMISIPCVK